MDYSAIGPCTLVLQAEIQMKCYCVQIETHTQKMRSKWASLALLLGSEPLRISLYIFCTLSCFLDVRKKT